MSNIRKKSKQPINVKAQRPPLASRAKRDESVRTAAPDRAEKPRRAQVQHRGRPSSDPTTHFALKRKILLTELCLQIALLAQNDAEVQDQ